MMCGGPLLVSNVLEAQIGFNAAFSICLAPVVLFLLGDFYFTLRILSILTLLIFNLYALWYLSQNDSYKSAHLVYFGITIGSLVSMFYRKKYLSFFSGED